MPNHEVERSWTRQTEEQREEVYGHTLSHRPDHYLLVVKLFRSVLCVCLNFSGSRIRRRCIMMVVSIVSFGFSNPLRGFLGALELLL